MSLHPAWLLALVAAVAACTPVPPSPPGRPLAMAGARSFTAAPATLPAAAAALPAGLYFRNSYVAALCLECATPRFAVVLAASEGAGALEAGLARGQAAGLAPGYPLALTAAELGLAGLERGGVVVAGLFVERRLAEALARALPGSFVLALATTEELERRAAPGDDAQRAATIAVQIEEAGAGWDGEALERLESALDAAPVRGAAPRGERIVSGLAALTPRCTVRAGRVHLTTTGEVFRFERRFAPATCDDGRPVWIPWTQTRLETLVLRPPDGPRLYQVTSVMCDRATIEDWPYVRGDRTPRPLRFAVAGGCRG